mgnify:CR=1 FL=1|tara:strand:+ start:2549 stop:2878 length:330 start_codon:yes stop_codon:yes gene_type:complete
MNKICNLYNKIVLEIQNNSDRELDFENVDGIYESIFNFPSYKLLAIKGDSAFIKECYYKILDRPVDPIAYKLLLTRLKNKQNSRLYIIKELTNSQEAIIKCTKIDWENR